MSIPTPPNPFRALLGIEVTQRKDGTATCEIDPIAPELLQAAGIVHGGALAALFDAATVEAARSVYPEGTGISTIEMNLNFVRPVTRGRLVATGTVEHSGRTTSVVLARLTCDDKLIVSGRATMSITPPSPTAER